MIDFIRTYHKNKSQFELKILNDESFAGLKKTINLRTKEESYPMTCSKDGFSIEIDEYRLYINCFIKAIINKTSISKLKSHSNLSFSKLKNVLEYLNENIVELRKLKLSGLHVGFTIPTELKGQEIIKMNILMHKFNYYNHNKTSNKSKEIKEFTYYNFKILFEADKKGNNQYFLKVLLKINKSVELKKIGINDITDLLSNVKIKNLFDLLIKKIDELAIIDEYLDFGGKDYEMLNEYLTSTYWKDLAKRKSRQTQLRHKRKFKQIIEKYNLNTQKTDLKRRLNKVFDEFISN
ncbi:hypothetical protein [Polaribacter atrinae]|uniref:hypothetical protein n=1 Tax=Polaribacter atrinae TaxID=1333662 RepID=UPI0030F84DE1